MSLNEVTPNYGNPDRSDLEEFLITAADAAVDAAANVINNSFAGKEHYWALRDAKLEEIRMAFLYELQESFYEELQGGDNQ